MRLMQPYLNMGRCLYVDYYYTSPPLLAELYRQNTGACGTAHYRKGIPQKFKRAQVEKKVTSFLWTMELCWQLNLRTVAFSRCCHQFILLQSRSWLKSP